MRVDSLFRRHALVGKVATLLMLAPLAACAAPPSSSSSSSVVMLEQGWEWTGHARQQYYTQDQGSRIMPLSWIKALKQADGKPFMEDSLDRYGYLPNTDKSNNPHGLPVGFVAAEWKGEENIGMTCSACHTRQIEVGGTAYRVDGGPAIADFQSFLADLDKAVGKLVDDPQAFTAFAHEVLGGKATPEKEKALLEELKAWYLPYHTIIEGSLPAEPWGPSRLDAVSMIFNRVTGLDIGPPPTYIIKENIKRADVPVRYPFLWNASIQDTTQWPGFAGNGNRLLGLSRNLGEVFGVFAKFHPKKDDTRLLGFNYVEENSGNFDGLNAQESAIRKIGPPKWPKSWPFDKKLADKGEEIFNKKDPKEENLSCADCHGIKKGKMRSFTHETWATPLIDVGTDTREINLLGSQIKTGMLEGAFIFPNKPALKAEDSAFSVLGLVVGGAIIQHYVPVEVHEKEGEKFNKLRNLLNKGITDMGNLEDLQDAFKLPEPEPAATAKAYKYESRVMQGIWAAAPYLHNGSVPTLADLLKAPADRPATFKVGPAYDIKNLGLAAEQTKFGDYTTKTTGCATPEERNSGNSRCGHEYGVSFSDEEKKALLEYLKKL